MANPNPKPGFQKGHKFYPKKPDEFAKLCLAEVPRALEEIVRIMKTAKVDDVRLRAAQYIMDRALGKPRQAMEVSGEDGGAIQINAVVTVKDVKR